MEIKDNYININKEAWNKKTTFHVESSFYDMPSFLSGKSTLNSIELELLGDITGKKILHLQCHFGQDTISLSRMGAIATGVDFSDAAITKARELAETTGTNTQFICCDIYSLPDNLNEQFDILFTSYGTIGWLPDLDRWAKVINHFLKPGGNFIIAEFHPFVWMFDPGFSKIDYSYFNEEAIIETETGTYADKAADMETKTISWNHDLSEVFSSLINNNLEIKTFKEYNYSPYDCFNDMEEFEPKRYRIPHLQNKIPFVYALKAVKK
ncbi:class I SAM-dependent methyltransferase [Flavobacterium beibuense]|uniref:class I SAM-dependent methyltransferase n=1 Tax=Flavobacterium beibuense TaxID=657326 RepID=UPI003A92B199